MIWRRRRRKSQSKLVPQADIPAVLFGPARGLGAHGGDERAAIDQLIEGAKALALAIIAWCGVETE